MKRLALALLALALPFTLFGAVGTQVVDGYLEPAGYVQITSLGAAAPLTSIPDNVKLTLVQAEAQDVRWRDDGTDPTPTVGMLLEDGQTLVYNGKPSALQIIEVSSGAKLNVSYYR